MSQPRVVGEAEYQRSRAHIRKMLGSNFEKFEQAIERITDLINIENKLEEIFGDRLSGYWLIELAQGDKHLYVVGEYPYVKELEKAWSKKDVGIAVDHLLGSLEGHHKHIQRYGRGIIK